MGQAERSVLSEMELYPDLKSQIRGYWTKRSSDFAKLRRKEWNSPLAGLWLEEICARLPRQENLRILDAGTGSGFVAFLLGDLGCDVTGIDLTPSMIREAEMIGNDLNSTVRFRVMDAENLLFGDESFDVVISRNLTWTLPHPDAAYREWFRVLKKGGVLINFDGNYGKEDFAKDDADLPQEHVHRQMDRSLAAECNRIKDQLEISFHQRPAWDIQILEQAGFETIGLDLGVSRRIYREVNELYNPTPLFAIQALKP